MEGGVRRIAYRADHQGNLEIWHIPKKFDPLVEEFLRSKRPVIYDPTIKQSFEEMWPKLSPSPATIAELEVGGSPEKPKEHAWDVIAKFRGKSLNNWYFSVIFWFFYVKKIFDTFSSKFC